MAQPPFPLMRLLFLEHCDFLLGLLALFLADMLYDYLCLLCYRLFVRIVEMVETPLPRIGLLCSDVLASPPAGTQYIESSGETDEGWQVHSTALGNGPAGGIMGEAPVVLFFTGRSLENCLIPQWQAGAGHLVPFRHVSFPKLLFKVFEWKYSPFLRLLLKKIVLTN